MKTIQIAPGDNVAVALCPIPAGELVQAGTQASVKVLEDIPQGHKIALKHIAKEDNIIKYGFAIGHATAEIPAGSWVHTHNMATNLSGEIEYSYHPELKQPASEIQIYCECLQASMQSEPVESALLSGSMKIQMLLKRSA